MLTDTEKRNQAEHVNEILALNKNKDTISTIKCQNVEWLTEFIQINMNELRKTILRSMSEKGLGSLEGYTEGYFNEAIQNVNDLNCANEIYIDVSKNGNKYTIVFEYADDEGFSISNIYAFLNREMSDKSINNGQAGKFGIGIKSFFLFADSFEMESNIKFSFYINRNEIEPSECLKSEFKINNDWNKINKLTVTFTYSDSEENKSKLNVGKLARLIDYLDADLFFRIKDYFYNSTENNLVFDICSLLFMGFNKSDTKFVKSIKFINKNQNKVELKVEEKMKEKLFTNWNIEKSKLSLVYNEQELLNLDYLIFKAKDMYIAYPIPKDCTELNERNRLYSTFFVKVDDNIINMSALINGNFINITRTDIGNGSIEQEKAIGKIKNKLSELYEFMCSKEAGMSVFGKDISIIFHSILYQYREIKIEDDIQSKDNPLENPKLNTQYLPKVDGQSTEYIVLKRQPVEEYQKIYIGELNSEKYILDNLEQVYELFIAKGEVIDYGKENSEEYFKSIKPIYEYAFDNVNTDENEISYNKIILCYILNAFPDVSSLLNYRINENREIPTVNLNQMDDWIVKCKNKSKLPHDEVEALLLKLLGRYEINEAITKDGTIIGDNFTLKDYLFNADNVTNYSIGVLRQRQGKIFESQYADLKKVLKARRFTDSGSNKIRYLTSANYNACTNDFYDINVFSVPDNAGQSIGIENLKLFIARLECDAMLLENIGNIGYTFRYDYDYGLFEKDSTNLEKHYIKFKNKYKSECTQEIICLNFLKSIYIDSFNDFKFLRDSFEKLNSCKNPNHCYFIFNFNVTNIHCSIKSIQIESLVHEVFPWLFRKTKSDLPNFNINDIENNTSIKQCDNQTIAFIKTLYGYNVYLYSINAEDIDTKQRQPIGYFGKGVFKVKLAAAESIFEEIGTTDIDVANIYIFYANTNDIKKVISTVLKDVGINDLRFLEAYISKNNNIQALSYENYSKLIEFTQNKIILKSSTRFHTEPKKCSFTLTYENYIKLLVARGSYDNHCPICGNSFIEESDTKLILLDNSDKNDESPFKYFILVGCNSCFSKLSHSLIKAEWDVLEDIEGLHILIKLYFEAYHGTSEKFKDIISIKLSFINMVLTHTINAQLSNKIKSNF